MTRDNVIQIPRHCTYVSKLVAAIKTRNPAEVLEAVETGIKIIGENYAQETEEAYAVVGNRVKWHFIGHLQSNKAKKAVRIFGMIETVDSVKIHILADCSN